MRIRKQRMEALGVLPAAAQDRDFYYAGGIPCCFSRSRCNWLDKLRASKGLPMEPKVEIDDFVKSLSLQGSSSGESKSGLTATATLVSSACIATRSVVKDCSVQQMRAAYAGECKQEPGEDVCTWNDKRAELLLGSTDLVQSEHCDSFDPDTGCRPAGVPCRNISNSSEGQSQVCGSNKSSPEIDNDNADMANGRAAAENNKLEYVFAFGLPPGDFEQSMSCYITAAASTVVKKQRKRKQERPRNCPKGYDSPGQEVTGPLLQRRDMELRRSYYMLEKGSPESENPNPSCRMQLTLRDDYVTATPLKTCMEKMQAFSLRSNSSTESDGNSSDSTSDSLNLHRRGIRRRTVEKDVEGNVCSKRRKLYVGAAVTPFQVEGQSLHRKEHVAHLQMQRRTFHSTGFIADFHTMRTPQGLKLPLDHPACQPKDTLVYSVYQVFMKAGKTGLTAREAVSKILEEGLPGLDECGVVARVEVGKIVRTSPYFMELEESKFVLCSAITGIEDKLNNNNNNNSSARADKGKDQGNQMQNWAALAVRRARTGKTRRKSSVPVFRKPVSEDSSSHRTPAAATPVFQPQRKRRLKSVQQDSTGLGNRCNRSDGKGWHCPLLAQVGYLLCDHHLDRLRAKSGSKARRPNRNRAERRAGLGNNGGQEQHHKQQQHQAQQQQQQQSQQHQPQQHRKGTGIKAPSLSSAANNRNSKKAESWGIRQSLSVARGGRRKRVVRCLPDEEQATESGEVITTTFGL